MMPIAKFAERIKELRTSHDLTQKEFGQKIDVSAATLSAYECGDKSPTMATAGRIAEVFSVSLDWLWGIKATRANYATCGDVARLLCEVLSLEPFFVDVVFIDGLGNVPHICTTADWITKFLSDYHNMGALLAKKTISREIFDFWLRSAIEALNGDEFVNDDGLPF